MSETEPSIIPILLYTITGMLVLLLLFCWFIARRLARIERRLVESPARPESFDSQPSQAETQAGGAFEMFLGEDPARRALPKSEQFAAYRKWRQEKGLNWSGS